MMKKKTRAPMTSRAPTAAPTPIPASVPADNPDPEDFSSVLFVGADSEVLDDCEAVLLGVSLSCEKELAGVGDVADAEFCWSSGAEAGVNRLRSLAAH